MYNLTRRLFIHAWIHTYTHTHTILYIHTLIKKETNPSHNAFNSTNYEGSATEFEEDGSTDEMKRTKILGIRPLAQEFRRD